MTCGSEAKALLAAGSAVFAVSRHSEAYKDLSGSAVPSLCTFRVLRVRSVRRLLTYSGLPPVA